MTEETVRANYKHGLELAKLIRWKKYSDQFTNIEESLLKSYIFVRVAGAIHPEVVRAYGVLNHLLNGWKGKLALIKQTELDEVKDYLSQKI